MRLEGFGGFSALGKGAFRVDAGSISEYRIKSENDSEEVEVEQFVGKGASLNYAGAADTHDFYLYVGQLDGGESAEEGAQSALHIEVDEKSYVIGLRSPKRVGDERIRCANLPTDEAILRGEPLENISFLVGVRVHIAPAHAALQVHREQASELTVKGDSGWVTVRGINKADLWRTEPGRISFLIFHAGSSYLDIDGKRTELRPFDSYAAFGDLRVAFENSDALRFTGSAWAVWREQRRINSTRWEKLGGSAASLVLGVIGGIFLMVARMLGARLASNQSFRWLSPKRSARRL